MIWEKVWYFGRYYLCRFDTTLQNLQLITMITCTLHLCIHSLWKKCIYLTFCWPSQWLWKFAKILKTSFQCLFSRQMNFIYHKPELCSQLLRALLGWISSKPGRCSLLSVWGPPWSAPGFVPKPSRPCRCCTLHLF